MHDKFRGVICLICPDSLRCRILVCTNNAGHITSHMIFC